MRRKEYEKDLEFGLEILKRSGHMALATFGRDGYPYVIFVSPVYYQDKIYFHCAMEGEKIDNLRKNPKVCLSCYIDEVLKPEFITLHFDSLVIRGTAREIIDEKRKDEILLVLCEKWFPDHLEAAKKTIAGEGKQVKPAGFTGIWEITIDALSCKSKRHFW
ncbi:MAG: pyridoxamine 5'-phosphate oxidase family protein [Erysipelotrichaceae bacterium]|jgi:nitroimidazol reductase NimA-like FMN-containing flavoprotein (pyridoxamine 5'-phosphate oxidase superfamily)|nr:pyridoxamine 5'-phosphate oxidase family protein [Erysipelotrichaceae bacterium]